MNNFDPEEVTRVDIKHPSRPPAKGADLCVVTATEGNVGKMDPLEGMVKVESFVAPEPIPTPARTDPRGPKSKFTPELQKELLEQIADGIPIKTSCAVVGISEGTFYGWKGAAAREPEGEYARFFIEVARARAFAERNLIYTARQGDGKEWSSGPARNAQWLLERQWAKDYAPRLNTNLKEMGDITLAAIERVCGAKDCGCYAAIIAALSDGEAGSGETA
jgi:hypothetical protein